MHPKPKKSLGQNFLIDEDIINLIVEVSDVKNSDIVIEVGPGTGNLTEKIILKKPKKLILIEKDNSLVEKLNSRFKENIILLNEDIAKCKAAEPELVAIAFFDFINFLNSFSNLTTSGPCPIQLFLKTLSTALSSWFVKSGLNNLIFFIILNLCLF